MQHSIRGSDVFIKNDLRAILDGLDIAARHQPAGCFRDGWLSATNAMRASIGIEAEQPQIVTVERYERYERIEQRCQAPTDMTGDDVNITVFNPSHGRMVECQQGYGWIGNDGHSSYWDKSDWQLVNPNEARSWGELIPEQWLIIVRHAYAERMRRQLTGDRRLLR